MGTKRPSSSGSRSHSPKPSHEKAAGTEAVAQDEESLPLRVGETAGQSPHAAQRSVRYSGLPEQSAPRPWVRAGWVRAVRSQGPRGGGARCRFLEFGRRPLSERRCWAPLFSPAANALSPNQQAGRFRPIEFLFYLVVVKYTCPKTYHFNYLMAVSWH